MVSSCTVRCQLGVPSLIPQPARLPRRSRLSVIASPFVTSHPLPYQWIRETEPDLRCRVCSLALSAELLQQACSAAKGTLARDRARPRAADAPTHESTSLRSAPSRRPRPPTPMAASMRRVLWDPHGGDTFLTCGNTDVKLQRWKPEARAEQVSDTPDGSLGASRQCADAGVLHRPTHDPRARVVARAALR